MDIFNADEFGLFYEAHPSKSSEVSVVFEEWLHELDGKFETQGRKFVMIIALPI